jgi:hypothetical protein
MVSFSLPLAMLTEVLLRSGRPDASAGVRAPARRAAPGECPCRRAAGVAAAVSQHLKA